MMLCESWTLAQTSHLAWYKSDLGHIWRNENYGGHGHTYVHTIDSFEVSEGRVRFPKNYVRFIITL